MKSKLTLLPLLLSILAANNIQAEYQIIIHLDPKGIIMEETPINGTANLSPTTINRGESAVLTWNYDYANNVNVKSLGIYGKSGTLSLSPLASRNYEIEVTKGSQKKIENLFLTVIQPDSNISFSSNTNRIGIGQSVVLNWNVSNARNIDIDNGVGFDLPLVGSSEVYPTTDTTFTLSGFDYSDNPIISSVFVDVVPNSIINSFNASALNITTGESVTFNWDVTDSESLYLSPYGSVLGSPTGSQAITFNTAGAFDFTLQSTSLNGSVVSSTPIGINVYNPAVINSYTINGVDTSLDVSPNETLNFEWTASNSINYTLNGNSINGNSTSLTASSNTGTTNYVLAAFNGAGDSVTRSLSVNVVGLPVINTFTGPNTVFTNTPLTLSWTGTGISRYEIKSNNATSGISTTEFDLGSSTTINTTPTTAGSYIYTLSGYNTAEAKADLTKSVVVESNPTFTNFTVNGSTSISVSPNASLNFVGTGFSAGSTLQGRNSSNTADAVLPLSASVTAGTYTYYASATKTLNGITRNSNVRSVSVTVVDSPTIGTISSPTNVFANAVFSMTWSGTNVVNYKIRGNVAASGVATTDVDLGTTASRSITPTAAGTYTYTITATNAVGVETISTRNVTVEADPTFTGFTVNGSTSISVSPSTPLTYAGTGFSTGATLVGRNSGNTANATNPTTAPAISGTYTYYAAATKALNSISRYSNIRSVSVTVVDAPTIGTITAPTNVFANTAFTMSWSGTNVVNYKIRGNVAASGVSTTDVDLGTTASRSITPTAAGTYTYTITATNSVGIETTSTRNVTVEADPTFTGFTVNGAASITVAPSTALTFAGTGFSSGAALQGRNSGNTADAVLPTTASTTAGTTTYYAAATKTLNSLERVSALRSVSVTVVNAPTIGTISSPTNVFANSAFSMTWSGTNVTSYAIRGNVAASGVATTDIDLGTTASRSITPTAAGTYTYTITATNAAGVETTSTRNVTVEADPTFTGFTVNGSTSLSVAPSAALTFAGTGFSSGAALQGRNSGNTADAVLPTTASASVGTTTYYAAATKTLNSLERVSALRSVSVTVVANPTVGTITAPTNVFANAAFTMSWTGTNVTSYAIRGNVAASGVSTTNVNLGATANRSITPTAAGTYTYTITATNSVGATATNTINVVVEANPTISNIRINNSTTPNVMPGAVLTPTATLSSGSTLVDNVPNNAPTNVGPYTYTYSATKTLNGITRTSANSNIILDVGHVYDIVVGRYGDNPYGHGYLSPNTGWTVVNAGSMSNYSYKGVNFLAVYTATDAPSNHFYINFVTTNGFFDNKQIRINGVLCNQTVAYYDYLGSLDTYQYHSCSSNLTNLTGNTVKLYISN